MQTKNQRVNRLMYLAAGIVATIIMTLGLFTQAKASTPIIAGCSSAYRKNANQATAWVYSNTAGKIYYVVDEQESTTLTGEEIVAQGTQSGSVALNGICGASLNIGMYAGTKYAHLVVVDDADATNISDVMTIKMAEDYMFSETFEAYPDNYGASVSGFEFGADNKVVTDGGQKVYQVYGNGGENTKNASIDSTQSGDVPDTRILEGKIKSGADSPVAEIGMYCWDGGWSTWDPAA